MKEKETKKQLLTTAQKHFALYNYGTVSLKNIASEAGIAKSTLFHYFDSKDALYMAVIDNIFQELKEFLRNEKFFSATRSRDRVLSFFRSFLVWLDDNPDRAKIMIRVQLDNLEQSKKLSKRYWSPILRFIDLNVKELSDKAAKNSRLFILEILNSMIHFVFSLDSHLTLFNRNRNEVLRIYESHVLQTVEHMLFSKESTLAT